MSERERFEAWARTQPRHEGANMRFLALNNAYIDFDLHGAWLAWQAARSGQAASGSSQGARSDERTGWPPGLLQDDSRELSRALASKPDAMAHARDAVAKIGQPEAPTADRRCQFCKGEASGSRCPTAEGCAAHGCHGECLPEDQEAPTAAALVPFGWVSTSPPKGMFTDEKDIADAWSNARINVVAVFAHPPARSGAGSEEGRG